MVARPRRGVRRDRRPGDRPRPSSPDRRCRSTRLARGRSEPTPPDRGAGQSLGRTWRSVWAGANRSPTSATRSGIVRIVQRSGRERRVVELVPGDRRRDRRAGRGSDGVRRDERLDVGVLGVVEPRPAVAPVLRPLPARRGPARSPRPRATRPRPRRSSRRSRSAARSGSRPGCRACRSASGSRARRDARARSGRGGRGSASRPMSSARPGRCR